MAKLRGRPPVPQARMPDGRYTGKHGAPERLRKFIEPTVAHRMAYETLVIAHKQGWSDYRLTRAAGIAANVFTNWRHRPASPRIETLEAVLDVLGYQLAIVPKESGKDGSET